MDMMNWIKNNKFVVFISIFFILSIVFIVFLFVSFESTMCFIGLDSTKINTTQWHMIKNTGYVSGILLLIIQISISNRRATAAEKTAEATLSANIEQRYDNAVNHLTENEPFIRIGAIYSLYHISQSSDSHDNAIFDIFCACLKRDINNSTTKEKQIIIDKLFRINQESRVLKDIKEIDLTNANLTNANLTNANLTGADLTETDLTGADLTEANLTEANLTDLKIPYAWDQWDKIKSLKGAKLDNIRFGSGVTFKNRDLTEASFKKAKLNYMNLTNANLTNADLTGADLTGADLTGADLTSVIGLNFEQLSKVKCLYNSKNLDIELEKKLKEKRPKLFKQLKDNDNEHQN